MTRFENVEVFIRARIGLVQKFSSQTFSRINSPTASTPVILHNYPPVKMEQTGCSETSAYKIQTPGNYPEESIQHSEQGESSKSRSRSRYFGQGKYFFASAENPSMFLRWSNVTAVSTADRHSVYKSVKAFLVCHSSYVYDP